MPPESTANLQPIPILVYHQIDKAPLKGRPFRSLYVTPSAFARQMQLLKWLGFSGLSMGNLLPYLRGQRSGKVVGITFDDGYVNNLTHALPVLNRFGFSSTCYAVSQLAGKTNSWDEAAGIVQTNLMNRDQMQKWIAGGQEIGSHTRHHVNLLETSDAAALDEIALGKSELEAAVQASVNQFCYPYGKYEKRHADMAASCGFTASTTTRRSRCHNGTSLLEIPRVPVVRSTSLPIFWVKLNTAYEDRHST